MNDASPNEFSSPVLSTPTAREMQFLASLMLGKTNREIGRELFVAESTVKLLHAIHLPEAWGIYTNGSRHRRVGDVPDVAGSFRAVRR